MGRSVLFVSYGAGHIAMVLPVMRALSVQHPDWKLVLFAPTTAAYEARKQDQPCLTYQDFAQWYDPTVLSTLAAPLLPTTGHPNVPVDESIAYLGINLAELEDSYGADEARKRYEKTGRWAFYPLNFMRRVIQSLQVDMVVATNSPRTEAAALEAATALGLPTLCMVDLFSPKGDPFLYRSHYADMLITVSQLGLNNLVQAGIPEHSIKITGNPAFDSLGAPEHQELAIQDRGQLKWEGKKVILWPGHLEILPPEFTQISDPFAFPIETQTALIEYILSREDTALIIRFHPNHTEKYSKKIGLMTKHPRILWSGSLMRHAHRDIHLCDICVVQATTVGLEAAIAGKAVLSLDHSPSFIVFPCSQQGISLGISSFAELPKALDLARSKPFKSDLSSNLGNAAQLVSDIISNRLTG